MVEDILKSVQLYPPNNDPAAVAKEKKQELVIPKPNQLLLDIDTPAQQEQFVVLIHMLMQYGIKVSYTQTPSKTFDHYHITVEMDIDLNDLERVALQAILGSDPKREFYGWVRCRINQTLPSVFFENKEARI